MTFLKFFLKLRMLNLFPFFFFFFLKPQISFTESTATITFSSEKPLRCELSYGKESPDEVRIKEEKKSQNHTFLLKDLIPGTSYEFQIQAEGFLSPIFSFRLPSQNDFRIVYLPESGGRKTPLHQFLRNSLPHLLITGDSIDGIEKEGKVFLLPTVSPKDCKKVINLFGLLLSFGKSSLEKKGSNFSILFSFDSCDLSGKEDFDIVFVPGGEFFARSYPLGKNPYSSKRPGLILSSDSFLYSPGGVCYYFVPSGKSPSFLFKGNQYLPFLSSGSGLVEITKKNEGLKLKTFLLSESDDYLGVDSFLISGVKEEELKISGLRIKGSSFSARISWETNLSATSLIEWGFEPGRFQFLYPALDINQTFHKEHTLFLFGIFPEKRLYYRVGSRRGERIIWSEERSFVPVFSEDFNKVLAVDFTHPFYKSEPNYLSVSPFSYPKRDSGANLVGCWDRDLEFSFIPRETSNVVSTQHWIRNSEVGNWSFPIPPGRYYYEIGSFSSPLFPGKTKINLSGLVLEKEEGDTVFSGEVEVNDYSINLQLGYGDSLVSGYSGISYLLLFRKREEKERNVLCLQASPNPFKKKTVLKYHLLRGKRVIAEIYDATGKKLFTLKNRFEGKGYHECVWDGNDLEGLPLPDGIYFIAVSCEDSPPLRVKVSLLRE